MRKSSLLLLSLVAGIAAPSAHAFNWNKETVKAFAQNRGRMEAPREARLSKTGKLDLHPGGHNLATRRAMDLAILKGRQDRSIEQALTNVYGETLDNLYEENGFAFQKLLWGNFSNEMQTMLDADAKAEKLVGHFMSISYSTRRGILGQDGRHSKFWKESTGYTSSNLIHSMLVTSSLPEERATYSQEHSMKAIKAHVQLTLESVLRKLVNVRRAQLDNIYIIEESHKESAKAIARRIRNFRKWYKGDNQFLHDSRYEYGMRDLGNLLHGLQDSSVACTAAAKTAPVDPSKDCVEGDGHGIVRKIGNEWKVVSLSDGAWYARKDGKHAELDNLYQPGNLVAVEDIATGRNVESGVYGSFDPAIAGAMVIIDVAQAVEEINAALRQVPAYITLSEEEGRGRLFSFLGNMWVSAGGKRVANDDSLTKEWMAAVPPLVTAAAENIAKRHILSRYADKLEELPAPPTAAGAAHAHGEEH